jgi:hypothetical protein
MESAPKKAKQRISNLGDLDITEGVLAYLSTYMIGTANMIAKASVNKIRFLVVLTKKIYSSATDVSVPFWILLQYSSTVFLVSNWN